MAPKTQKTQVRVSLLGLVTLTIIIFGIITLAIGQSLNVASNTTIVDVASRTNVKLDTGIIDHIALSSNMRVLLTSQTNPAENGVYRYQNGKLTYVSKPETLIYVLTGESNGGQSFIATSQDTYSNMIDKGLGETTRNAHQTVTNEGWGGSVSLQTLDLTDQVAIPTQEQSTEPGALFLNNDKVLSFVNLEGEIQTLVLDGDYPQGYTVLQLATGNSSDTTDTGFVGQYDSTSFTGLLRDASTKKQFLSEGLNDDFEIDVTNASKSMQSRMYLPNSTITTPALRLIPTTRSLDLAQGFYGNATEMGLTLVDRFTLLCQSNEITNPDVLESTEQMLALVYGFNESKDHFIELDSGTINISDLLTLSSTLTSSPNIWTVAKKAATTPSFSFGTDTDSGMTSTQLGSTAIALNSVSVSDINNTFCYMTQSNSKWTQQGGFVVPTGSTTGWKYGRVAVSANGSVVVVGSTNEVAGNKMAWTFNRQSDGSYVQQGQLVPNDVVAGNLYSFGFAVDSSADGKTVAVSDYTLGFVWVFVENNGSWTQQGGYLAGTGELPTGQWSITAAGIALSEDGNTLVKGGVGDNNNRGACWVFTRSGTSWTQQGPKLVATSVGTGNNLFNISLSGDGNTLVSSCGPSTGALLLSTFIRTGTTWSQTGADVSGLSICRLNSDGTQLVAFAPTSFVLRVYYRVSNTWVLQTNIGIGVSLLSLSVSDNMLIASNDGGNTRIVQKATYTWSTSTVATISYSTLDTVGGMAMSSDGSVVVVSGHGVGGVDNPLTGFFAVQNGNTSLTDLVNLTATPTSTTPLLCATADKGVSGVYVDSSNQSINLTSNGVLKLSALANVIQSRQIIYPSTTSFYSCGSETNRWTAIYAINDTIQTSDRTKKTDIQPLSLSQLLSFLELQPISFEFISYPNKTHWGLSAQDVEAAIPEMDVGYNIKHLQYMEFVAFLIQAIQLLTQEMNQLNYRLEQFAVAPITLM